MANGNGKKSRKKIIIFSIIGIVLIGLAALVFLGSKRETIITVQTDKVVKRGKTDNGKQRYLCQDEACSRRTFLLVYTNRGYLPVVKRQIIDLALNGSGIRDTARVLGISTDTVLSELKKRSASLSR